LNPPCTPPERFVRVCTFRLDDERVVVLAANMRVPAKPEPISNPCSGE